MPAPVRFQGRISNWSDGRGFGFITPNGGGNPVFVHIKAFADDSRRPLDNDLVNYELGKDAQGRERAERVRYPRKPSRYPGAARPGDIPFAVVILFFAFLGWAALQNRLPWLIVAIYAVLSVLTYAMYAADKAAAQADRRRTPEDSLHLVSVIGGWPGALIAQRVLRHKSQKRSFRLVFWVTVLVNSCALAFLLSGQGRALLQGLFRISGQSN